MYKRQVATLAAINEDPEMDAYPEHGEAVEELRHLEEASRETFREFIHAVAEELPEDQSRRYLERMSAWCESCTSPIHAH